MSTSIDEVLEEAKRKGSMQHSNVAQSSSNVTQSSNAGEVFIQTVEEIIRAVNNKPLLEVRK